MRTLAQSGYSYAAVGRCLLFDFEVDVLAPKMSCFLCIFVLATLPNVMALSCYTCIPGSMANLMCASSNLNVTDCDTMPGVSQGMKPDACLKVSYEVSVGNQKLTANAMSCGMKSMCGQIKDHACNQTSGGLEPGMTMTKCDAECCYEDKCNGLESPNTGSIRAASVIGTFLSVMTIFAGVFIH